MKVELLDRDMVDSDLGIVNAARCSFDKESSWEWYCATCNSANERRLKEGDKKLIHYLASHAHWTPFAHAQETFALELSQKELLHFLHNANLSGFEWPKANSYAGWRVRGSLYAWLTQSYCLPRETHCAILDWFFAKYPVSSDALWTEAIPHGPSTKRVRQGESNEEELIPLTLRLHVPIFVKRQLETHRRNFVLSEGEDFAQNEVSRRYVQTTPEFYTPSWRKQSPDKKQGSSEEELLDSTRYLLDSHYNHHTHNSLVFYERANTWDVAHEQSRLFLPLSTYTTFWWTGSLKAWKRMFDLRLDIHAQEETREVAEMCYTVLKKTGLA